MRQKQPLPFFPTAGICSLIFFSSCGSLKESSKYQLIDGYYTVKNSNKKEKLYILAGSDSIKAYRKSDLTGQNFDTAKAVKIMFPAQKPIKFTDYTFRRNSFDIDVLTILFKYRPMVKGFPPQFNATFNGAVYFGFRTDFYRLSYYQTPIHVFKRKITHYGYSFGVFTGLGSARIDEYDTNNALAIEYDGLVNLSGVAAIVAIDKLTAGLTFGVDHLLDRNNGLWVNNRKPWIGLSLGLNLN